MKMRKAKSERDTNGISQPMDQGADELSNNDQKRLVAFFKNQQHPLKELFEHNRIDLRVVILSVLIKILREDDQPWSKNILKTFEHAKKNDSSTALPVLLNALVDHLETKTGPNQAIDWVVPVTIGRHSKSDGVRHFDIEMGGRLWMAIYLKDAEQKEEQRSVERVVHSGLDVYSVSILDLASSSKMCWPVRDLMEEALAASYTNVRTDDVYSFWALTGQEYDKKSNLIVQQTMSVFSGFMQLGHEPDVMGWTVQQKAPLGPPVYSAGFYSTQRQVWPSPRHVDSECASWELGNHLCELVVQSEVLIQVESTKTVTIADWAKAAVLAQTGQWFNTESDSMPKQDEIIQGVLDVLERDGIVWLQHEGKRNLVVSHTPYTKEIIEHCQVLVELRELECKLSQTDHDTAATPSVRHAHLKRRL